MTDNQELYDWHLQAVKGNITAQSGSVVQLDDTGTEKLRWNFFNAWPSKWDGPAYNAKGNDVAIETLTLTCDRIEMAWNKSRRTAGEETAAMFQTEHEFTLPFGYVDDDGNLHRDGVMRLATAARRNPAAQGSARAGEPGVSGRDPARRASSPGWASSLRSRRSDRRLYAADLAYLQELYNRINRNGKASLPATCPQCSHSSRWS